MALSVSVTADLGTQGGYNCAKVLAITFDSSYATGGEALTANECKMGKIVDLLPFPYAGYVPVWDGANSKLKMYAAQTDAGGAVKQVVISGGAAGNHTVTGIATSDTLISVVQFDIDTDTGTGASGNKVQDVVQLTSEFTITATNTINNGGGTATTGDKLLVTYYDVSASSQEALNEVTAATNLSTVVIPAIVIGTP